MSVIDLADAKAYLDVFHSADDEKLQGLLDGAEQEALDYMNRKDFSSICPVEPDPDEDEDDFNSDQEVHSDDMAAITAEYGMPASVRTGVLFLLQSAYQASPEERLKLRDSAINLLAPFRCGWGA